MGPGNGGGAAGVGGGEEGRKSESRRVVFAGVSPEVSQEQVGAAGQRGQKGGKKNAGAKHVALIDDTVSL